MARPLYSLRIFAAGSMTNAAGIVGPVVPPGLIYVLRDIDVVEISGGGTGAFQAMNPLGGVLWIFQRGSTLNSADGQWRGRQVFDEGETVGFTAVTGTWSAMASGYQLTKP